MDISPAILGGIIGSLLTALVTIPGWYVVHRFTVRREAATRSHQYLKDQIDELYGPLAGLIQQIYLVYEIRERQLEWLAQGGKEGGPEQLQAKFYFYEHFFAPLHDEIVRLIQSKRYFLRDGALPKSFQQYLRHAVHQQCIYGYLKGQKKEADYFTGEGWPTQFEEDVRRTLQKLLEDRSKYLGAS